MKLIECTIRSFGCFQDEHIVFSDGLNVFHKPNGWGKTTLSVFLKAMLYGLSDSRKRDLHDNERQRYLPWDATVAGGSLTYEQNGRRFRIERTFHKKSTGGDDTFTLYDLSTGAPCPTSDTPLGEELFGIDAEAFERTVFLSEKNLSGKTDNRSIAAKLSDLVGTDGDIGALDGALSAIDDKRKEYHKLRGGGEMDRLDVKLREAYQEKQALTEALSALSQTGEEEARLHEEESRLRRDAEALRTAWKQTPGPEAVQILRRQLEAEQARQKTAFEKEQVTHAALGCHTVPSRAEVRTAEEAKRRLSMLTEQREAVNDEVTRLSTFFSRPTDEGELADVREALHRSIPSISGYILAAVTVLLCAVLSVALTPLFLCLLPVGVAAAIWTFVIRSRATAARKYAEDFIHTYPTTTRDVHMAFDEISHNFAMFSLQKTQENAENTKKARVSEEIQACQNTLRFFCEAYGFHDVPSDFSALLYALDAYDAAVQARTEAERRIRELQEQIAYQAELYTNGGRDRLEAQMNERQAALEELLRRAQVLSDKRKEADALSEQIAVIDSRIEQMAARHAECKQELAVLQKTAAYLKLAAERLSERYKEKTQTALRRYLSLLQPQDTKPYHLSTTFDMRRDEGGTLQPIDAYSKGTRELYFFALRLSLVDALFEKEQPFLLLDDPFANLDDEHVALAKSVLTALSADRQILYFTCTAERAI